MKYFNGIMSVIKYCSVNIEKRHQTFITGSSLKNDKKDKEKKRKEKRKKKLFLIKEYNFLKKRGRFVEVISKGLNKHGHWTPKFDRKKKMDEVNKENYLRKIFFLLDPESGFCFQMQIFRHAIRLSSLKKTPTNFHVSFSIP